MNISGPAAVAKPEMLFYAPGDLTVTKNEMFYGFEKNYPSFEIFSKAIADYIDYYNNHRIQAKTKWMPPSKFRKASMSES